MDGVKLINFNEGCQKQDIDKSGKVINDYWRVFTYNWGYTKKQYMNSRVPYVLSCKTGKRVNECNTVIISQVNVCNMYCWSCFVDDKFKDGSHGDFINYDDLFKNVFSILKENKLINVYRISGGEPSLFPGFIKRAINEFSSYPDYGLIVDTNLTNKLSNIDDINQENVALSMCVKGVNPHNFLENSIMDGYTKFLPELKNYDERVWYKQLDNLREMEEALDDYTIYLWDLILNKDDLKDLDYLYNSIKRPWKVEILQNAYYEPTYERFKKLGIKPPEFEQYLLLNEWRRLLADNDRLSYDYCLKDM